MSDANRGGSGFSFDDIAADRAGIRFAETMLATDAEGLRSAAATLRTEDALMPGIAGLPSFMPEAEFKRRFGSANSAAYREMIAIIDERIDALPLYRGR